jgi:predicted metal-dependent hydrolase
MIIEEQLQISDNFFFPVIITIENRSNCRASIGKKAVNIKISQWLSKEKKAEQIAYFKQWALKHLQPKADIIATQLNKNYKHGDILAVRGLNFLLHVNESDRKNYRGRIAAGNLFIEVPKAAPQQENFDTIRTIVMKMLANFFYMEIANRLIELNEQFFQKNITDFSLKYMTSRWGSCSYKGTINISSRLLLAPNDVMDYVLIHELAHLVHMNHSPAFWKEVAKAMPDYKQKEKWLRDNDYNADF